MTDEMTHIVLEHLRHIRSSIDDLKADVRGLNMRGSVVDNILAGLHVCEVGQNDQIDRIKQRLDRIERRLDLAD